MLSEQLRLVGRTNFRIEEIERLKKVAKIPLPVLRVIGTVDKKTAEILLAMLHSYGDTAVRTLGKAVQEVAEQEQKLVENCQTVHNELNVKRMEFFEVKAEQNIAGQVAFLMSVDNRWFWLFGLMSIAVLAGVVLHERRHEVRRWLNGGKARSMGLAKVLNLMLLLLVLATSATFLCGNWLYQSLLKVGVVNETQPMKNILAENELLSQKREEARKADQNTSKQYNEALETWTRSLPKLMIADRSLRELWEQFRKNTEEVVVGQNVLNGLTQQLKKDLDELEKVRKDIDDCADQRAACYRKRHLIHRGLGLGLLGVVVVIGAVFERSVRRRQKKIRNTCPLCLGEGSFQSVHNGKPGHELAMVDMMQCKSLISEQPREECRFTLLSRYLDMSKLCFPTLGVPAAGKTHWLAMTYRQLTQGKYPKKIKFAKVRSTVAEEFDKIIDHILFKREKTTATPEDRIPRPLVFNFADWDRLGRSDILVNIFDYSGEVTIHQTLEDRQRWRALDGDGFLFFLDHTVPSVLQERILDDFRDDLCAVKHLSIGKQLNIPVALCISKIDLLAMQPYTDRYGDGVIDKFYQDLAEIGWDMDLQTIEARSNLVARLHEMIWPGWQIERKIDDLFGGRYLFFPLTPVGLDGLSEKNFANRTYSPLGLLDPLLWLLHMNGYPVF